MNRPFREGLSAGWKRISRKIAERGMLLFFVACLGIPAVLTRLLDVEVPLSALACLASVPFYFLIPNIREKFFITAAFFLSVISVLFNAVFISRNVGAAPFLSLVYFFSPYLLFFSGYRLVRSDEDMSFALRWFSVVFALVSFVVVSGIFTAGGTVRVEGELLGSLLGMKLYGTYGVNSLAVFFATMFAVMVIHVFYGERRLDIAAVPYLLGMAGLLFLLIGSLSREAILGCGLFVFLSILYLMRRDLVLGLLLGGIVAALGYVVLDRYGEAIGLIWSSKLGVGSSALGEGDLDAFSSGRITLYRYAVKDILRDPVFGNGFHGFFLHISPGLHAEAITENNSPHNQFLTAVWKMGVVAGTFYLLFLYRCMKNLFLLHRSERNTAMYTGLWFLMLVYILVFCSFWDVLLVPLIGMFLMFLLGGVARIHSMERLSRSEC